METDFMTTAYWCVLVTICLPYVWVALARLPGITLERNLIPRIVSEEFTGARQRAYWAHLNALEAIVPFAAAVMIAQSLNVQQETVNSLALTFVGFRIAHALAYISNRGVLRTVMFAGGFICIVALFVAAI
jgi:uncharacterized MAPEG superfamily protein